MPPPPGLAIGEAAGAAEVWEVWWCYDAWHPLADRLERLLPPWAKLCRMRPGLPLAQQVSGAKVLIPTTGPVTGEDIRAAEDLRLVAQPAAGYNNIDVEAARARGVPVTIAPGYNAQSTAEVALLLMLMLARRVPESQRAFAARTIGEPAGQQLGSGGGGIVGKTVGIVGMGAVGRRLAAAVTGLGCKVLGTTSASTRQELEHLLRESHVVSLHCPLTPITRGLIGRLELMQLMRPDALLINCARGEVVDKQALMQALEEGRLGGVGLDVTWDEPADPNEPLYRHPKVITLPHLGCATEEAYDALARVLCHNIVAVHDHDASAPAAQPPKLLHAL